MVCGNEVFAVQVRMSALGQKQTLFTAASNVRFRGQSGRNSLGGQRSANSQKRTLRTRVQDPPPMAQGSASFWHRSGQLYARRVGDGVRDYEAGPGSPRNAAKHSIPAFLRCAEAIRVAKVACLIFSFDEGSSAIKRLTFCVSSSTVLSNATRANSTDHNISFDSLMGSSRVLIVAS